MNLKSEVAHDNLKIMLNNFLNIVYTTLDTRMKILQRIY
jgi:hypothetical protein